ncbi:MAG: hypothetical protein K2G31_03750 [Clostridia bacterium]|nr:hypothetical protein [Clostridia bacterium]
MKVIGIKIIDGIKVPIIVECASMAVDGQSTYRKRFNPDHCRIFMRTAHPSLSYFIIKTERYDDGTPFKPYKWLTHVEADAIMKCAAESDVIDLRGLGDYQICSEGRVQSVFIMNDIDDCTGEDSPILVKIVDGEHDEDDED